MLKEIYFDINMWNSGISLSVPCQLFKLVHQSLLLLKILITDTDDVMVPSEGDSTIVISPALYYHCFSLKHSLWVCLLQMTMPL